MVRLFLEGMQPRVQDNDEVSEPFPVSNGIKQGCVLAPTLFRLMFSAMLNDAFCAERVGVNISYRKCSLSRLPQLAETLHCGRNPRKSKKKLRIIPLTLGAWNVRTLMDRDEANRPQRRTVRLGLELACYNIDIASLSETRLADVGELSYTFFWRGRGNEEGRQAGVCFAVKTSLIGKLLKPPKGIND